MRRLVPVVLAVLALPMAGCLKSKDVIVLNKDGSGTIKSTYEVDLKSARDMFSMAMTAFGQGDPEAIAKVGDSQLLNYENPAWYRQAAKKVEGYDLVSVSQKLTGEPGAEDRRRTTKVDAKFSSLQVAGKADALPAQISLSKVDPSKEAPKGAWKLVLKPAIAGVDPATTGGIDPLSMISAFEGYLKKKLDVRLAFTAPTRILETNGKKSEDGRTATLEIDYDRILEGDPTTIALTVVFEAAEDLELRAFSHAPDLGELRNRLMMQPPKPATEDPKKADGKKAEPAKDAEPKKDG